MRKDTEIPVPMMPHWTRESLMEGLPVRVLMEPEGKPCSVVVLVQVVPPNPVPGMSVEDGGGGGVADGPALAAVMSGSIAVMLHDGDPKPFVLARSRNAAQSKSEFQGSSRMLLATISRLGKMLESSELDRHESGQHEFGS